MYPFTYSNGVLTIVVEGVTHTVDPSHPNYKLLIDAVKSDDEETVANNISVSNSVRSWSGNVVEIRDGVVYYKGEALSNGLTDHILRMMSDGFDVTPFTNFLEKLMLNPSYRSREQLFRFVDSNKITITSDGNMILYKRVRDSFKDHHTNTMDNSVGTTVEMDRTQVDDDPNRTCSAGLHVCSLKYALSFAHGPIVLVSVSPADVVSVPTDYDNTKMRVSKYTVIGIHQSKEELEDSVYDYRPSDLLDDYYDTNDGF